MTDFKRPKCGGPYFGREVKRDRALSNIIRCHCDVNGKAMTEPCSGKPCGWRGLWPLVPRIVAFSTEGRTLYMTIFDVNGDPYDVYEVPIDPSIGKRAVAVHGGAEPYYVIDYGKAMECECKGCLRWGYCKHIDMAKHYFTNSLLPP